MSEPCGARLGPARAYPPRVSFPPPPPEFHPALERLGVQLEPGDEARLGRYLELLQAGNERMNLTAIRDPAQAWIRHVQDSLSLVPFVASAEAETLIDVGSGGGLPGMVLACALPSLRVTLLEATGKKARFLEETAAALGLSNVTVLNARAEEAGQDHKLHRERYHVAVCRAVGHLAILLELALPLVRTGGTLLAVKGAKAAQEVAESAEALRVLQAEVVDSIVTGTGTVVVVHKVARTPRMWPRLPGEPERRPLGVPR